MFANLKAFMQGWNEKGDFPNVPPFLPKPYTEAVISYYEHAKQRLSLRMLVCDANEETVAFDFSYDVFPLSMASAIAHIKNAGREERYRFIDKALTAVAIHLGRNKPEYEVGRVLHNENEIARLHQLYRLAGSVCSISEFARTPIPYATLVDAVYAVRAATIIKTFAATVEEGGSKNEKLVAFVRRSARQFLSDSTKFPDGEKQVAVLEHISHLIFILSDIPD